MYAVYLSWFCFPVVVNAQKWILLKMCWENRVWMEITSDRRMAARALTNRRHVATKNFSIHWQIFQAQAFLHEWDLLQWRFPKIDFGDPRMELQLLEWPDCKNYNLIKRAKIPPAAQVRANIHLQIHGESRFPRSTALRDGQWQVGKLLVAMWECYMESRGTRIS